MKLKLDLLERSIQRFIEGSARHFLWGDERIMIARKIVEALENETTILEDEEVDFPNCFSIQLHPDKYRLWQSDQELTAALSMAIQEAAVEINLPFSKKPILYLDANAELDEDELVVQILQGVPKDSQTAIMAADGSSTGENNHEMKLSFLILENGDHFPLDQTVINIGRRTGNSLVIDDLHISREHAQIRSGNSGFILFDLNSTGGTFVNGRRISQHTLQPGDVISLSNHPLIYVEDTMALENDETGNITRTSRIPTPDKDMED